MNIDVNVVPCIWTILGVIASFLVAFIALAIGVVSLIQTKKLQEKQWNIAQKSEQNEYTMSLLNEIKRWILEVFRENFGKPIEFIPGFSMAWNARRDDANRELICQVLSVQGKQYIKPIAEIIKADFIDDVDSVIVGLDAIRGILRDNAGQSHPPEVVKQIEALDLDLSTAASNLLKKIAEFTSLE